MDKDKEILFDGENIKKLADMWARILMPDTKILEQLNIPQNKNVEIDGEKWTFKIETKNT